MEQEEESALDRLFKASGCRTQEELAGFLQVRQSSISTAKKRSAIPAEWLVKLLRLKGTNPEWILTGLGPKRLGPASGEPEIHVVYRTKIKPPAKCSTQELVTELVRRALLEM